MCRKQQDLNLPYVEAAEDGEDESWDNCHGNCQKHWDYPVDPNPWHLKQGIAPDPHSVPATHWHGLSNHILKWHLETEGEKHADASDKLLCHAPAGLDSFSSKIYPLEGSANSWVASGLQ